MSDTIPQLPEEVQAEIARFIQKKQTFMLALSQAIAGGMKKFEGATEEQFTFLYADLQNTVPTTQGISTVDFMIKNGGYITILFSHDFAKAFFGAHMVDQYGTAKEQGQYIAWQFHLMQLAVVEDRLAYLTPFIKPIEPVSEWK